jgi:hypothetical protein
MRMARPGAEPGEREPAAVDAACQCPAPVMYEIPESPAVALYRTGDRDVLLAHPAIGWEAVRVTPRGRPSPLANLTRSQARARGAVA